jgi:cell fate regulator YaaT (PSP1 superfamily)
MKISCSGEGYALRGRCRKRRNLEHGEAFYENSLARGEAEDRMAVEVMFRGNRKEIFASEEGLVPDDLVVCRMNGREYLGKVRRVLKKDDASADIRVRRALPEDMEKYRRNLELEKTILDELKNRKELGEAKLAWAEADLERTRMTLYLTSEKRIEFRKIFNFLKHKYKMKIEVHQIGVREYARMLGGYGPCGRELCCATFLRRFEPVTFQMIKEQNLSLGVPKLSGFCGRLLCCLLYERDFYKKELAKYPKVGAEVETERGKGVVTGVNIFDELVQVRLGDGVEMKFPPEGVKPKKRWRFLKKS